MKYAGIVFFCIIFLIPLALTFTGTTPSDVIAVLSEPYFISILRFTFRQAAISTIVSLVLGLPGAWIMSHCSFRSKRLVRAIYSVSFVLPSILVVLGFVIFYGNSGYLNSILMGIFGLDEPPLRILYSFKAVVLAHAFYNFPVIVTVIGSYWSGMGRSLEESAATAGAGPLRIFVSIVLPQLLPAIAAACVLVFLYCFNSFSIILVLGGGPAFTTAEVEIYRQARMNFNTKAACALSIVTLAVVLAVLLLQMHLEKKCEKPENPDYRHQRLRKPGILARLYIVLSSLFIGLPVAAIFFRALFANTSRGSQQMVFSLRSYAALFNNPSALINSLVSALGASVLGTAIAVSICSYLVRRKKSIFNILVMLPMAVSSVIIGLSYFLLSRILPFSGPLAMLTLAHCVIVLPFSVRTILPAWRAIPSNLIEDSAVSGADSFQTLLRVELPMLRKSIMTSLAFGFAISVGELNSVMLIGVSDFTTVPLQIYRLVGSYNYQGACALGTVLIALCFLAFLYR